LKKINPETDSDSLTKDPDPQHRYTVQRNRQTLPQKDSLSGNGQQGQGQLV
jgi:hypothetical protein